MTKEARPEAIRYARATWIVVLALEAIHQVLSVVGVVLNSEATKKAVRETLKESEQISDTMLTGMLAFSVLFTSAIAIAILVTAAFMVKSIYQPSPKAATSAQFLRFFGFYLAIRGIAVFLFVPDDTRYMVFFAIDGALQIAIGLAGGMAAYFGGRKESTEWVESSKQDPAPAKQGPPQR